MIHLDTHVLVWLYQGELERFPPAVRKALEIESLAVCPFVLLEIAYLGEIGRLRATADEIFRYLEEKMGLTLDTAPFAAVVKRAIAMNWTRDPFDRIIVAQAELAGVALVSKDETIRSHYANATW